MSLAVKPVVSSSDILEIHKMSDIIWHEHYSEILSIKQIDYMIERFLSEDALSAQLENGYEYYILTDGESNQGYFAIKPEKDRLFISKIYLYKACRGKGLAKFIFKYISDYAKKVDAKIMYLTVNKENKNSIEVYRHLGFNIVREEKTDIGSGFYMDDYIMEYEVNKESRLALISIIVENKESVSLLNNILHNYGHYILGRMGIPYEKKGVSIISIAMDAPNDIINSLSGKLGSLDGVNVKTMYSNK